MRMDNRNGYSIITLGYSDVTAAGQQSVNEGYAPSLNEADLKNPAILSEADIVVFQDKGLYVVLRSHFNESETDKILGIY